MPAIRRGVSASPAAEKTSTSAAKRLTSGTLTETTRSFLSRDFSFEGDTFFSIRREDERSRQTLSLSFAAAPSALLLPGAQTFLAS